MLRKILLTLKSWPESRRDNSYWFLALLGLLPALRADLLFPHTWLPGLGSNYSLPPIDNPFSLFAILLALLTALLAMSLPQRMRLLAVIPFVMICLAGSFAGQMLAGLSSLYVASAFAVFLYFIVAGRTLSLPFGAFLILLLLWQPFDGLLAWPQILVFVAASLALSLAVEAIRQNLPLARQLGRSNIKALLVRTFFLWWPMLILIAIGVWLGNQITTGTENLLYARGYVIPHCTYAEDTDMVITSDMPQGPFPCPPPVEDELSNKEADEAESTQWFTRLPFFENLDLTVERNFDRSERAMRKQLDTVKEGAISTPDKAETEARRLFTVVPESTGMTTSTCYFPDVACAAANIVINGLNSAYGKARGNTEKKFVNEMRTHAGKGAKKVKKFTETADKKLTEHLGTYEKRTRQSIDRVHTAANLLQQILWLWLLVMTIKSFLYVYARVIFDKSTDIEVDLLERDSVPAEGKVSHQQEVNIPSDYPYDLYYKANYQPLGPAPRFSIPQWRSSVLSRLRFGAWSMSWVNMPLDDERGVTFNSIEAEHIIDWEMEEGEEVVFSYRNFIAMNENIELRTVVSLRVATLLLGRIIFHTARCKGGPGRLLLRTRGKPATAEQVRRSIPAARLVAWNRYARFSVDSHLTPVDIFLNGFNLRRSDAENDTEPQGILIVEADARDGGVFVGTLRFAKNFLLPI